jgi:tetratricopeptide (TPR) repeat protein
MIKKTFLLVIAMTLLSVFLFTDNQDEGLDRSLPLGKRCKVGKQYLLVIAINSYKDWDPLRGPVTDAKEIKEILTTRYHIDKVFELYNDRATYDNIEKRLKKLQEVLQVDDSLLILYSGHGYLDRASNRGFWIPVDGPTGTSRGWFAHDHLKGLVDNIPSKHILLISDSCFAGELLDSKRGPGPPSASPPAIDIDYYRKIYSLRCRQVLTSGAEERVPDESEFARALKSVLKENNDLLMDGRTLYQRIRRGIRETLPMFNDLKGTRYEEGSGFLFFLKKDCEWWKEWQKKFQKAAKEAKEIGALEKVLKNFSYNNPCSTEDEQLRDDIKKKIKTLEDKENYEKFHNLAAKHFKKKHYQEAYKNIKKTLDYANTPEAQELEEKIREKIDDKEYEKTWKVNSLQAYKAYLEKFPEGKHRANAYFHCGIIYSKENNYREAALYFEKTIDIDDEDAEAHNNLGVCCKHRKDYPKSIKMYNTAINLYKAREQTKEIKRKLAVVYNNLGASYAKTGKDREAFENYGEALKLNRKYGNAHYNLGLYYLDKENYREAKKKFEKAAKHNKNDTEARKQSDKADTWQKKKEKEQNR